MTHSLVKTTVVRQPSAIDTRKVSWKSIRQKRRLEVTASMAVNVIHGNRNALRSQQWYQHSSIATPLLRHSRLAAQERACHWQRLGRVLLTKLNYSVSYSMSICFNASIALSIFFFTTFDEWSRLCHFLIWSTRFWISGCPSAASNNTFGILFSTTFAVFFPFVCISVCSFCCPKVILVTGHLRIWIWLWSS